MSETEAGKSLPQSETAAGFSLQERKVKHAEKENSRISSLLGLEVWTLQSLEETESFQQVELDSEIKHLYILFIY